MSMIYRVIAEKRKKKEELEKEQREQDEDCSSPRKTVLESLTIKAGGEKRQSILKEDSRSRASRRLRKPTRIEEVPFRRQDRRTLNARYRRLMDRKLIICIMGSSLLLLGLGTALLVSQHLLREDLPGIRPFVVIGPVLIGGGLMTALFSVEVCHRLHKANLRLLDPEVDTLVNPHEIKHWVDPRLIPYGWGLFSEDEEVIVIEAR